MRLAAVLALGVGLAGCGEAEPIAQEEILSRAASLTAPEPGLYRTTTTLRDFAMPGVSPQEAERMRLRFGFIEPQVVEACLDEAEAARGFLPLVEAMQNGACTFSQVDAEETVLNAEMRCAGAGGTVSQVTLQGEAGAHSSRLETQVVQRGDGVPGGEQRFTLEIATQRLGNCAEAPSPA